MKLVPGGRQMFRDLATVKTGQVAVLRFVVTGQTTAVDATLTHGLERTPSRFRVVRAYGDAAVEAVKVPSSGTWATDSTVTLNFPGDGEWDVEVLV